MRKLQNDFDGKGVGEMKQMFKCFLLRKFKKKDLKREQIDILRYSGEVQESLQQGKGSLKRLKGVQDGFKENIWRVSKVGFKVFSEEFK